MIKFKKPANLFQSWTTVTGSSTRLSKVEIQVSNFLQVVTTKDWLNVYSELEAAFGPLNFRNFLYTWSKSYIRNPLVLQSSNCWTLDSGRHALHK